jgi:hypothetical protein
MVDPVCLPTSSTDCKKIFNTQHLSQHHSSITLHTAGQSQTLTICFPQITTVIGNPGSKKQSVFQFAYGKDSEHQQRFFIIPLKPAVYREPDYATSRKKD